MLAILSLSSLLLVLFLARNSRGNERVYLQVDLENTKRLMGAMQMYAVDHNDYLPAPGWGTSDPSWAYGRDLPMSSSHTNFNSVYPAQLKSQRQGQLWQYVQSHRTFMCPADQTNSSTFLHRGIFVSSYVWNAAVNGYGSLSGGKSYKLGHFRPDAILQWEVDEQTPFFFNDVSAFPDEGVSRRHATQAAGMLRFSGWTPVGLFDGSASTMLITEFLQLAGSPGSRGASIPSNSLPNRLWVNPGRIDGR